MAVGAAEVPVEDQRGEGATEPDEISVTHARRKLVVTKSEIEFLKILLAAVSARSVPVSPSWPCMSEHYLIAQDLVVRARPSASGAYPLSAPSRRPH
tara:strand:- start:229 stop:519 length:291 start_codon:yes stop_codon:yes gene_type:complete